MSTSIPPLGPLSALPPHATGLKDWKILLLCSAVNSFSQRAITYLKYLGFTRVSVCIGSSAGIMEDAAEKLAPDLVICPFLTSMVPSSIFTKYVTLVVHPGPPGDEGPAALDWTLLGDTGSEPDSTTAISSLLASHDTLAIEQSQRSHWGVIVFQANEHVDAGKVWAWEQYPLPSLGTITKASLYQNQHSIGAISALITAMIRVYEKVEELDPASSRLSIQPLPEWEKLSVTHQSEFMGGITRNRPQIPPKMRKPDWKIHTAEDVVRIVNSSDSQPGAQIGPLVTSVKSNLFVYGAHLHFDVRSIPRTVYTSQGYSSWDAIPAGKIVAVRDGAVMFKTVPSATSDSAIGVWITHGRIIKKVGQPLDPKIPLVDALRANGQEKALVGVQEWAQPTFEEVPGAWQEVFVRTEIQDGKLAQLVYWNFYNGACSTRQCQMLLSALQWASAPERGNVKVLALMGGSYFSNGIALNTIEAASDPGLETWLNINAIDDIVEFLVSDTHQERSSFMSGIKSLCERGIVTVACVRANAAAGGVALAAGCDVTIAARGVVLNPAYRAMGLHGSEFHSFSYLTRCGQDKAASMLRDMLPQCTHESFETGLIDIEVGDYTSSKTDIENFCIDQIKSLLTATASADEEVRCAPWCKPDLTTNLPLIDAMSSAKRASHAARDTPLLHYRNEELSQMLLDSFHPVRSKRYHTRRYTFIRKIKGALTPTRYAGELASDTMRDEEELEAFDKAPGWTRGQEWAWAGLETPASLATSDWTRIRLYPETTRSSSPEAPPVPAKVEFAPPPSVHNGSTITSHSTSPARLAPPVPVRKDSTASQVTISSFGDGGDTSLSSIDSHGNGPLTPPVKSASKFLSFRRKSSGHSRDLSLGTALHQVDTRASIVPGDKAEEGNGGGRFKTLSKKFASAWKDISQPHPQFPLQSQTHSQSLSRATSRNTAQPQTLNQTLTSTTKQKKRSSILFGPSATSLVASITGEAGRKSFSGDRAGTGVGEMGTRAGYVRPKVKGEEECEYPCLYHPEGETGATPSTVGPQVVHA